MRAAFRKFSSTVSSWETLFTEAANFASNVGRDRLISISHSEDGNDGVVVVWYWQGSPSQSQQQDTFERIAEIDDDIEDNR